jgi:hypothetical protein
MAGGDVDVAVCSSACTHVPDELAQHAGECDALRACAPWLEECFELHVRHALYFCREAGLRVGRGRETSGDIQGGGFL